MAWITDSLRNALAAVSPFARGAPDAAALPGVLAHQLALAEYQRSGLLRKVIRIPADDRVREWRDWQADKDAIALIEAEERRLGLIAKVRQAEVLRGIGGGALILVTAGDHAQPLDPRSVSKGGLVAVNVVSRWQITARDFVRDLASPDYGQPRIFEMDGDGVRTRVHPSRVVCFRGPALPAGGVLSDEDAFWGDSRLAAVLREVRHSDAASGWFAELVKKAKLLRVGIANLTDYTATDQGRQNLASRVQLIAEGEHTLNATVYDAGNGRDPAEVISDYQVAWAGIPAMMDAFDQRVSAVSDIPFTRLMGRSPAGMNSTGSYDDQQWAKAVAAGQQLETRPCLEQIDPVLLRSAGIAKPEDVTWRWAPLWHPTEKEEADTFAVAMGAIEKVQATGAVPERAFAEGFQNWLEEREYIPGLGAALAKLPEAERFGLEPEPGGDDPSAIQAPPGE